MPNAATAASADNTALANNPHATELSAPIQDESISAPVDQNLFGATDNDAAPETNDETPPADDAAPAETDVPIPVRLKGKSLPQIIQEFAGLEREYGRQGNELGEARTLLREALKVATEQNPGASPATDEVPDPTDEEFDTSPKAAAEKLVDKKLKPIRAALTKAEQEAAMLRFEAKRPGYQQEAASPEFQAWLQKSPYRRRLFQDAARFDMAAAEDLYSAWDDAKPTAEAPPSKKEALKKVTTETGGAGKAAGTKSGKKIYKSSELMRLFVQDRDRYNEMAPEIRAAFAEGRVR